MSDFGDPDPFGTPESEAWLREHTATGRDRASYEAARDRAAARDRQERRLRMQEERTYGGGSTRGATRPRRARQAPSRPSRTRLPSVTAQDAERTMAWQLVLMWTMMIANDLAPGPTGRGGTARGQALPKPRQFMAAALVWILLSIPASSSNQSLAHASVLLGWLIVLAKGIQLLHDNPQIMTWITNVGNSPKDLYPAATQ